MRANLRAGHVRSLIESRTAMSVGGDLIQGLLVGRGVLVPLGTFILIGVVVFAIASRLARHASAIADATSLGHLWIGTVLLAASTSLPELTVDVNAALLDTPDIGVGDLMGSTLANMLVLALLDLSRGRHPIFDHVSPNHVLVGTIGVVLTAMVGAAIASGGWGRIGHVGTETLLIVAVYLLGMSAVYRRSQPIAAAGRQALTDANRALLRSGLAGIAIGAVGLIITAPLLVLSAEAVAVESGLSQTFVGTLLVGFTTSFPEIAATAAAVRLGAFDLAVGNIFGSTAFNMCVLLVMDLAYVRGPLLAHVSQQHLLSAQLAVLAISLGMLGLLARGGLRLGVVRIESVLIVLTYAGAAWLLASG